MRPHDVWASQPYGATQRPGGDDQIVSEADHRNEIWDQVDGLDAVEERQIQTPTSTSGYRPVPCQAPHEPNHIGHEPGRFPDRRARRTTDEHGHSEPNPKEDDRNQDPNDDLQEHCRQSAPIVVHVGS